MPKRNTARISEKVYTLAPKMSEKLGQPIVIDNKPGANSIVGVDALAKSPPDGYTFAVVIAAYAANTTLYPKLPYDALRDFAPVTQITSVPVALVVHPSVAASSVKELVALAKARPGVMWFGEFQSRGSCTATSFGSTCGVSHEKDFALDLGGVVEFYPAERAIIRVDVGNTLVNFQDRRFGTFTSPIVVDGGFKSNFQASLGFSWRF